MFEDFYKKCFEDLTPVEMVGEYWLKREDKFSPFEKDGANGSKLRQLIWLIKTALEEGKNGVSAGAVSASPQHLMVARVCEYLNIPCTVVCGVKDVDKFPMLSLAKKHRANFLLTNIGYAAALQSKAFKLREQESYKNYFALETNITLSEKLNSPEKIREFHKIGAEQVKNIPDFIDSIVLPCGSCNSAVSVLYGLYLHKKINIKKVYLMGIGSFGSSNINYIIKRLNIIDPESTKYLSEINVEKEGMVNLKYHNLNGEKFCVYADEMPFKVDGFEFHPRYEGKIMNYIKQKDLIKDLEHTLFWVVGSEPKN